MHVVIVSDFAAVNGGAAKVAVTSARGLADAGIPVTFVHAIEPASALLDHPLIAVHCLGLDNVWGRADALAAALQGIWNGAARTALDALLARVTDGETLVHFHQWTKAFSPSVLAAPANHGLPSAVSLHDYFFVCPNGAYYRYRQEEPCQLTPMSAACIVTHCDRASYLHKTVRVLRQYATRYASEQAGPSLNLISVSPFAERVMEEYLPPKHARFVVRSAVTVDKMAPAEITLNRNFLFAGRLTPEKGVRLVASVAMETNLPLVIAGDGPLLSEVQAMGGSMRCTGWLDDTAMPRMMRSARALLFPSSWYETGGLIVLEALAHGVPVIVSRTTAAADFVEDGVNGFVIEPRDRTALKARMLAMTDDALAARLGEAAYSRYWDKPQTVKTHTDDLLRVYRSILAKHPATAP